MTSRFSRLAASVLLSTLLVGGAFGSTPALADGAGVTTCAWVQNEARCIGFVVDTSVQIVIRDIRVLSGNEITILGIKITDLLKSNDILDEQDLQTQYTKIANGVLPILQDFGITVCSVEVANLSTASC